MIVAEFYTSVHRLWAIDRPLRPMASRPNKLFVPGSLWWLLILGVGLRSLRKVDEGAYRAVEKKFDEPGICGQGKDSMKKAC